MFVVLIFGIFSFFLLFNFSLLTEVGEDVAINITHNVTKTLGIDSGFSTEMLDHIDNAQTKYAAVNSALPIDLFFLVLIMSTFILTVLTAIQSRKSGVISFFGFLTVGSMIFLFVLTFVEQVRDWLMDNFYYNIFDLSSIATPIADYYLNNSVVISFLWFIVLILINQFDGGFSLGRADSGRFQE